VSIFLIKRPKDASPARARGVLMVMIHCDSTISASTGKKRVIKDCIIYTRRLSKCDLFPRSGFHLHKYAPPIFICYNTTNYL